MSNTNKHVLVFKCSTETFLMPFKLKNCLNDGTKKMFHYIVCSWFGLQNKCILLLICSLVFPQILGPSDESFIESKWRHMLLLKDPRLSFVRCKFRVFIILVGSFFLPCEIASSFGLSDLIFEQKTCSQLKGFLSPLNPIYFKDFLVIGLHLKTNSSSFILN
jgi:hypothetical protein